MPLVQIDVLQGHSVAHRRAILDGVHAALVECFKIPDHDRSQVLREHVRTTSTVRPAEVRTSPVSILGADSPSRCSREAKRDLFAAIVRNLRRAPAYDRATCSLSFANRLSTIGASAAGSRPPASIWASRSTSS